MNAKQYTPSTNAVRTAWTLVKVPRLPNEGAGFGAIGSVDEFDRWLAKHDSELLKKVDSVVSECWPHGQYERFDEHGLLRGLRRLREELDS